MNSSRAELSTLEQLVLPELLSGTKPTRIGTLVHLSNHNVRVAIMKLKMRYGVESLEQVRVLAREEFGAE